jgi:hypothetical protein
LGLALLFLRVSVHESEIFKTAKSAHIQKGNFFMLFSTRERFFRYMKCILIGMPTWFVVGILIYQSYEFGKEMGFGFTVNPAVAIMSTYAGLSVGDLACGLLSQWFRSRKKAMYTFVLFTGLMITVYLNLGPWVSEGLFQVICFAMGMSVGFWAVFVTIASEQFGTNIRATVTTTVPNFVRGALTPITILFQLFREMPVFGRIGSAYLVGFACIGISLIAIYYLEETFGKDLDFVE